MKPTSLLESHFRGRTLAPRHPETKRRDRRCIRCREYYGCEVILYPMSRSREEITFNRQSTYFLLGQDVLNGTFFKNVSKGG
ncbi:unnamed protein product [Coffea canephora]|uniref:DH200=94 genomic scaffold, scaffold_159 n=1 Tax=Coffea canephora TaxID=49390 RepID=A0A068VA55_COFCA|nr:unnamed protein product [Coffea canephora]